MMAPKWALYSKLVLGCLTLVLTNLVGDTTGVIPPQVVAGINTILPILMLLERTLGGENGHPPVTFLPPTPQTVVASLETQQIAVERELVEAKAVPQTP